MDIKTKDSFKALLKGAWESTRGERPRFFLFVVLFILAYSIDLAVPWAIGYTLGVFIEHGFSDQAFELGLNGILAYTGLRLANTVFHHLGRYVQNTVAYTCRMGSLTSIFTSLLRFPLRWHVGHHSGESLSKLNRSAGAIDSIIGTYVWQIIEGVVKIVIASAAIFTLDFWVAMNVLVMSVATILVMVLFNRRVARIIRKNNIFGNKVNRICVDYLSNIVTVKTLGLEQAASRYLSAQQAEGLKISKKISKYMELKWGSTSVGYAIVIGSSLYLYFTGQRDVSKTLDVAQVYVLLNYLDRIFQAIGSFTGYYSGLIEAATAYEDATEIVHDSKSLNQLVPPAALEGEWSEINIDNLHFSYVVDEQRGLKNVSFGIKRNEKIAIVGPSGGGKSTLLKVLSGLIVPEMCSISSDTQSNISIDDFSQIGLLIPQEPEIFSETIRYNLTMGEDLDSNEISFFISLCRLERLLAKLPAGWETNLAEKGLNLSVGEKQRVALARGLLRAADRQIILLDEPTSSLDPLTEKEIFRGLLYHFTEHTIITTCHRINLVPLFDKIIYMENGTVQEVGSFNELLERKGLFYNAWDDYLSKDNAKELTVNA